MDYRLPLIILLLAGCTAPAVQPPPTTPPEPSGVLVTVADYEGPLALRFDLKATAGTNCTYRQEWVARPDGSGIDYFIIREGEPGGYIHGGSSENRRFVQVGDQMDTRRFNESGDVLYGRVLEGNFTLESGWETIVLVFGHLEHAAESPVPGVPTLLAGFDCHAPGSVKLLGAGTEVVPILFDRFNSTAAASADAPLVGLLAEDKVMAEGRLSASFSAPLVEVCLQSLGGNDVARIFLNHPQGQEDWSMVFNPAGVRHEFFGGPGAYTLEMTNAQASSFWGVMMGFDDPGKLAMLNVTGMKVPHVVR